MSATEQGIHARQRSLPLEISARSVLITLEAVRIARGCDAESVINCVGAATHPKFLRWVFDVSVRPQRAGGILPPDQTRRIRELRFWKDEILADGHRATASDKFADPAATIALILGTRTSFQRGEIEVQWCINATTISRLVRAGELTEVNHRLTRASLAAFLERRLQ